jgi:hypothetical protein
MRTERRLERQLSNERQPANRVLSLRLPQPYPLTCAFAGYHELSASLPALTRSLRVLVSRFVANDVRGACASPLHRIATDRIPAPMLLRNTGIP